LSVKKKIRKEGRKEERKEEREGGREEEENSESQYLCITLMVNKELFTIIPLSSYNKYNGK
jgi:hypothetical protein